MPRCSLRDSAVIRHREMLIGHNSQVVVMLSHEVTLPAELKRYSARFELTMPTGDELAGLVREEASNWSRENAGRPVLSTPATFKQLVHNLKGVSIQDARQLVRGAIFDDGEISP